MKRAAFQAAFFISEIRMPPRFFSAAVTKRRARRRENAAPPCNLQGGAFMFRKNTAFSFCRGRRNVRKKRRAAVIFGGRGEYIKTVGRGDKNLLTGFDIVSVKTIKFKDREKV